MLKRFLKVLNRGGCAAFVVRKGALEYSRKVRYENQAWILREEAIRQVAEAAGEDVIVSTPEKHPESCLKSVSQQAASSVRFSNGRFYGA